MLSVFIKLDERTIPLILDPNATCDQLYKIVFTDLSRHNFVLRLNALDVLQKDDTPLADTGITNEASLYVEDYNYCMMDGSLVQSTHISKIYKFYMRPLSFKPRGMNQVNICESDHNLTYTVKLLSENELIETFKEISTHLCKKYDINVFLNSVYYDHYVCIAYTSDGCVIQIKDENSEKIKHKLSDGLLLTN